MYRPSVGDSENITQLLSSWTGGNKACGEELTPLVYEELQRIARRIFRTEDAKHTLQPTALVHEAYVKLINIDVTWQDRAHFYALAARMMRRLLINHANARAAAKRGGGAVHVTLTDENSPSSDFDATLLDINQAMEGLAAYNQRMAELIELRYFGGLSVKEMIEITGLSERTIGRDIRFARAWLKDALSTGE